MDNTFIKVPAVSKAGKDLGSVRLNLANVLYFRDWATDTKDKYLVAYLTGGKEVVIKMEEEFLEALLKGNVAR